jgi:O-antigen/teichoic acid export membrane protein
MYYVLCGKKVMLETLSFGSVRRWFLRGGTAILDQGVFSGANFILNILLARWLDATIYGAFAVAFTIYIFFTGFHNAIILEPISVLGPANYHENLKGYLASQFRVHFLITIPLGLLMILTGWFVSTYSDRILGSALISIGIVLPFLLLIWLSRRIAYLLQKPNVALFASSAYMFSLLSGMFFLHQSGYEGLPAWYLLMGLASLLGSIVSQIPVGINIIHQSVFVLRGLLKEQWLFGRWIVLATFFYFLGTQIQILVVSSRLGLDAAGAFRAMQNFSLPVLQVFAAITTLIFPVITFEFGQRHYGSMRRKAMQVTMILAVVAISYEFFLIIGRNWLDMVLYEGKYSEYTYLIPLIGLIPVISSFAIGFSLILRSLQRPVFYLTDKIIAAIVGSLSAFLLVRYWDISGAVFSLMLVELTTLGLYWYLYLRWFCVLSENNQSSSMP